MSFVPPTETDDWYRATALSLMHIRLHEGPEILTRAVVTSFVDDVSSFQLLMALAKEIGQQFREAAEYGPVGVRTAQISSGVLAAANSEAAAQIGREALSAGQLVGVGGRGDYDLAIALVLPIVTAEHGLHIARRVARRMLDILASEPIETSTPERPSSDA